MKKTGSGMTRVGSKHLGELWGGPSNKEEGREGEERGEKHENFKVKIFTTREGQKTTGNIPRESNTYQIIALVGLR